LTRPQAQGHGLTRTRRQQAGAAALHSSARTSPAREALLLRVFGVPLPDTGLTWRDAMKSALKLKAEKPKAIKTARPSAATKHERTLQSVDALLDEALSETFPASDAVSLTQPSRQRRAALRKPARRKR
jgi:hypothetical protein